MSSPSGSFAGPLTSDVLPPAIDQLRGWIR
jgi:hypothetical protein